MVVAFMVVKQKKNLSIAHILYINSALGSTGVDACGQDGSMSRHHANSQPAWLKQKLNPDFSEQSTK